MEPREESVYLKQFVKQHPENKMAWYLLGKEYSKIGKESKANYCFIQAGKVYEAFERKQHPIVQQHREAVEEWARRRKRKAILKRSLIFLALLFGLTVYSPPNAREIADSDQLATRQVKEPKVPSDVQKPIVKSSVEENQGPKARIAFSKRQSGEGEEMGVVLAGMTGTSEPAPYTIAVRMQKQGKYRVWPGANDILFSARPSVDRASLQIKLHQEEICRCEPEDASEAEELLRTWGKQQETSWTLSSALQHYYEMTKQWPKQLDDLIGAYPNNYLAGDSPAMRELFPSVLERVRSEQQTTAAAGKDREEGKKDTAAGNNGRTQDSAVINEVEVLNLPQQPLEIIVDVDNYRLAVVSGDVIVRSYPIGLGGAKTPHGTFHISEKVKNPNGRDNGEFGSRGMTLSDTLYAIHGTNEPDSIGKDESLGCVRMGKEDVEELYDLVPLGTKVTIGGKQRVPEQIVAPEVKFKLKPLQNETNPGKVYRWL
ncbi:L,D-transpeptidase [Paenibacillaceae bacterium]|nr:L,D-transpeptidase [Paenibacillaceae bacterium]